MQINDEVEQIASVIAACTRLSQILSGIGPLVATAIVAAKGNGLACRKGRDFARNYDFSEHVFGVDDMSIARSVTA